MSILWRKKFPIGENLYLAKMMKADGSDSPYKGGICPCSGYYIATLCPCPNCSDEADDRAQFIGTRIANPSGGFLSFEYEGKQIFAKALEMIELVPRNSGEPSSDEQYDQGEAVAWPATRAPATAWLYAIDHYSKAAPFDGNVYCDVYDNGTLIVSDGPYPVDMLQRIYIGENLYQASFDHPLLIVEHEFAIPGCHNIDLAVRIVKDDESQTVEYVCRTTVFFGEGASVIPQDPYVGDVVILPTSYGEEECSILGKYPDDPTIDVPLMPVLLKGPFDNMTDASFVRANWGGLIDCYATTCSCPSSCATKELAADYAIWTGSEWKLQYTGTGQGGIDSVIIPCENGELVYTVSFDPPSGCSITGRITYRDGSTDTFAAGSGNIPPCAGVEFFISGPGIDEDWVADTSVISGSFWNLRQTGGSQTMVCCLDDPNSEFYGADWNYDENNCSGVPNDSEELRHYLANCGQSKSLLEDLPEELR